MPRVYIGKELVMHASKKFDEAALQRMRDGHFGEAAQEVPVTEHPLGAVGVFRLAGSVPLEDFDRLFPEHPARHWAFGPHVWLVTEAILLPKPVVFGGRQGVFQLTGDEERSVRAELLGATHAVQWDWPGVAA